MVDKLIVDNLAWIHSLARTFCKNALDAEDLAGDTILKVLTHKNRYDPSRSFRLWVLVIMRNTFRIGIRHSGIVVTYDELPDTAHDNDPCRCCIVHESMEVIDECVVKSIGARSALLYAHGYTYNEIAENERVSVNIVKSRIHQGRRFMSMRVER